MPAITATNVRAGRAQALVAAFQAAKGTPASVFTGALAAQLWVAEHTIPPGKVKVAADRGWMTSGLPDESEVVNIADRPGATVRCHATPASVEWMLRSNWGTYSGGAFALEGQVTASRWLTLGYIENTANTAGKLVRVSDAWFHRVAIRQRGPAGILQLVGDYAGELVTPSNLGAGGITLPSSYAPSTNVFAGASAVLTRDPASANVAIRLYELEILLDQGIAPQEWDMMRGKYTAFKAGRPEVRVRFGSVVSDETWAVIDASRAGTKERWRLVATAPSPAKTLTINLYGVDFEIRDLGRVVQQARAFEAVGRAHVVGSDYVTIQLA